jgi:hypothetical protein
VLLTEEIAKGGRSLCVFLSEETLGSRGGGEMSFLKLRKSNLLRGVSFLLFGDNVLSFSPCFSKFFGANSALLSAHSNIHETTTKQPQIFSSCTKSSGHSVLFYQT